jgi:polyhydroxyalkanoate synthesis repressor PhaR
LFRCAPSNAELWKDPAMNEQRLIRKYVNRRLYDTTQSRYVNLDELRQLVLRGVEVRVVEQATGTDITVPVLLQIIAEGQRGAAPILSAEFLAGLIRLAATERDAEVAARLNRALNAVLVSQPRSPQPSLANGPMSAAPVA